MCIDRDQWEKAVPSGQKEAESEGSCEAKVGMVLDSTARKKGGFGLFRQQLAVHI